MRRLVRTVRRLRVLLTACVILTATAVLLAATATDTFTEATTNTTLVSHTSDSGHTWTEEDDTAAATLQALEATDDLGTASPDASARLVYISNFSPATADYTSQITIKTTTGWSVDDPFGLVARWTSDTSYYAATVRGSGAAVDAKIVKWDGAAWTTTLDSGACEANTDPVAGDVFAFAVSGTSLILKKNGANILSCTDDDISAAGQAGIMTGMLDDALDDELPATVRLDDWSVTDAATTTPRRGLLLGVE